MQKTIVPIIVWLGFDPFRPVQNHTVGIPVVEVPGHQSGGVFWWMIGTSTVQRTPPEEYTARPGRKINTGRRKDSGG